MQLQNAESEILYRVAEKVPPAGIQLSQISKMGVSPFEEQIDQATKGAR